MSNNQMAAISATLIVVGIASVMDAPNLLGNLAGGFATIVGCLGVYNVFTRTA